MGPPARLMYGYRPAYPAYRFGYSAYQNNFLTNTFDSKIRSNALSQDIIEQTRNLANAVKDTLRSLDADPASAVIIDQITNDANNVCLTSLEEGLAGIETATQLVEKAGDDIKALIKNVEKFSKLKDPATVVKEVAAILRILEPLVKNIAPSNPEICQATPDEAFGSLRSLAVLVDSLASSYQLNLSPEGRELLKRSGSTIYAVTTFLTQLRETFSKFGESIRKGKVFTERIVAELNKINNLDLGTLDCTRPGDFSVAAQTLEDLSVIIEDTGVEALQEQLGINLNFVFY